MVCDIKLVASPWLQYYSGDSFSEDDISEDIPIEVCIN